MTQIKEAQTAFDNQIRSATSAWLVEQAANHIFAASTQAAHVTGDWHHYHQREQALLTVLVSRAARDCPPEESPLNYIRRLVNSTLRNIEQGLTDEERTVLEACPGECITPDLCARLNHRLLPLAPDALANRDPWKVH